MRITVQCVGDDVGWSNRSYAFFRPMHTIKRSPRSEAELDDALASALLNNREFALWFLSQTRFAAEEAECVQVRADQSI
jgi:hypothetical protein